MEEAGGQFSDLAKNETRLACLQRVTRLRRIAARQIALEGDPDGAVARRGLREEQRDSPSRNDGRSKRMPSSSAAISSASSGGTSQSSATLSPRPSTTESSKPVARVALAKIAEPDGDRIRARLERDLDLDRFLEIPLVTRQERHLAAVHLEDRAAAGREAKAGGLRLGRLDATSLPSIRSWSAGTRSRKSRLPLCRRKTTIRAGSNPIVGPGRLPR